MLRGLVDNPSRPEHGLSVLHSCPRHPLAENRSRGFFFEVLRDQHFDQGLPGHAESLGLAVQQADHPQREVHVDAFLLVSRPAGLRESRYAVMSSPASNFLSSSLAFIDFNLFLPRWADGDDPDPLSPIGDDAGPMRFADRPTTKCLGSSTVRAGTSMSSGSFRGLGPRRSRCRA